MLQAKDGLLLTFDKDATAGVIEFTVDGEIGAGEYDAVIAALEEQIARHGRVSVVEVIRSFTGMAPSLWWKDVTWGFSHLDCFARAAVVTDRGWIGPVSRAVGALMPAEIRAFQLEEINAAREWVRETPPGE
ncbi:SpoIIAA family protein [Stakelama tenebrarum]|uniref:STAS/SEC14 domain-containing protein n=1 Tax=Stakelama tenebrarum TaxID=2711215 RepID=A0A6G6Y337_9SPHN|nr:STAS/SEC14 domain-containing protein [Sphingosinithalassobacter tenebrarum]QIG78986.1 STAS/SEC14 domain-containing protein [Sphingosinithalassobacter tenebrarum]